MADVLEIRAENEYFDRAWERREEARRKAKEGGQVGGRHAQIALNRQNQAYLAKLAPNDAAVAHGSIRLDDGDLLYVGRDSIFDEDGNVLVINWRTQLGERFERATVQDPLGVARKRVFKTHGTQVVDFDDLIFADLADRVADLTALELSGVDDALLEDLNSDRNGTMRDIVRTIQAAQSHLMRFAPDTLLVIQGGPGTGKSAIALHRASWLLFNEAGLTPERMLIIGPNDTFTNYIKGVLPALGDVNVPHLSLRRLGPQASTRREEPADTARLKGEVRMATLLSRALRQRVRFAGTDDELVIGSGAAAVTIGRVEIEAQMEVLREAPTYNNGRQAMRSWLVAKVEAANRRDFRAVPTDMAAVDVALGRLWPALTAQQFVRDLLGSTDRIRMAAGDDFTSRDVDRLYRRAATSAAAEQWSDSDVALLDEADALIDGMPERFGHIIVDEAQDLSPMQLRSVARRSANGAMTVVGDIAQSTGPWARDSWDEIVEHLTRQDVPVAQEQLTYGYRVPAEIYDLAAKLLPYVAPGMERLTVVRPAPEGQPEYIADDGDHDLAEEVIQAIQKHMLKGRCVAVIATPEDKPHIAHQLQAAEISYADADAGILGQSVNLVAATEAKGLEFDAVVVVEPAAIASLDRGFHLLYIALTRATRYLTVVHATEFTPLGLAGVEPTFEIEIPELESPKATVVSRSVRPLADLSAALNPKLMPTASATAAEIRDVVPAHAFPAFLAEVARQLGVTD